MPVLTCTDMVAQCLDGQESGWKHFVDEYIPFAGSLLERHYPGLIPRREAMLREVLLRSRDQDAEFFRQYRGHSEREFLLHLRELVCAVLEEAEPGTTVPEIPLDWALFTEVLTPLSALERQIVWMAILSPTAGDAAAILRQDEKTVAATMAKTQDLLRGGSDRWSAGMLLENRRILAETARREATKDCPPPKGFLRLLDGQITWRDRQELEHHLTQCWQCVDRLCRFREVAYLSRRARPLSEAEAEPYYKALGLAPARVSRWKRLLGSG